MIRKHITILGAGVALALLPLSVAMAADTPPHMDTSGVNMQPAYPASALAGQEKGNVIVSAYVLANGTVKEVRLRQSSGFSDLDGAGMSAVKFWKFSPATKDGSAADGWTAVQLVFQPPPADAPAH